MKERQFRRIKLHVFGTERPSKALLSAGNIPLVAKQ